MKIEISHVEKSELRPYMKDGDVCRLCIDAGLNTCHIDEVCQLKLAETLEGKEDRMHISLDLASEKGIVKVRELKTSEDRPKRFIKITERGRAFFGVLG